MSPQIRTTKGPCNQRGARGQSCVRRRPRADGTPRIPFVGGRVSRIAFSRRGWSFCPSGEEKRQLLWAEWLCEEVLASVPHRHVVLTISRLLRPLFRRRRELLTELGRAAAEAASELVRRGLGDDARPGVVVSIVTAGDLVQWHPHLHILTTDRVRGSGHRGEPEPQAGEEPKPQALPIG